MLQTYRPGIHYSINSNRNILESTRFLKSNYFGNLVPIVRNIICLTSIPQRTSSLLDSTMQHDYRKS